jgi:hypothetical protein
MSDLSRIQQAAKEYRNSLLNAKKDLQKEQAKLGVLKRSFDKDSRGSDKSQLEDAKENFQKQEKSLKEIFKSSTT